MNRLILLSLFLTLSLAQINVPPRKYTCSNQVCTILDQGDTTKENTYSFEVCRLTCDQFASLWPKPGLNAQLTFDRKSCQAVNIEKITTTEAPGMPTIWADMYQVSFSDVIDTWNSSEMVGNGLPMGIEITLLSPAIALTLETNEMYNLTISRSTKAISVMISAYTIFGARHALTTLTQLMVYDEIGNNIVTLGSLQLINDGPAYPYRGLSLDTSRHFHTIEGIERTITALSYNKMNRLHWHMTDSTSWPVEVPSQPELLTYGAYSKTEVYTKEQIKALTEFALIRGVTIVPEIDAPAHVGEAFSFDGKLGEDGGILACLYKTNAVLGPPFGYMNPVSNATYDLLETIYGDYKKYDYVKSDLFHLGADEMQFHCWNSTKSIVEYIKKTYGPPTLENHHKLWSQFEKNNLAKLKKFFPDITPVIWSSSLTDDYSDILKQALGTNVIVEIWDDSTSNVTAALLDKGFRILMANADAWYLDCGFGSWVAEANTWCDPYKEWQLMYNNRPDEAVYGTWKITNETQLKNILGGESAIWSEMIDSASLEMKAWPRTAAVAERLWSNPDTCWLSANGRMQVHRERMVTRGIKVQADALQPKWCMQHEGECLATPEQWSVYGYGTTCPEYKTMSTASPTSDTSPTSDMGGGAMKVASFGVVLMCLILMTLFAHIQPKMYQ